MTTTRLRSLTLGAFRSFAEPATVTFPERGLVLVRGQNKDTGGSSGSGKSSLLIGIAQAFGYSPFPASTLQSWLTDEPLSVAVEFDSPEGVACIRRGSKTSLTVGGALIKGSVKLVEEKLQALVGLSPELLEALTYRRQKSQSLFLSMPDADKKEFLSAILGLDKFEAVADAAAEAAKKLAAEVKAKQAVVDHQQATVREQTARVQELVLEDETSLRQSAEILRRNRHSLELAVQGKAGLVEISRAAMASATGITEAEFADEFLSLKREFDEAPSGGPPFDSTEMERLRGIQRQGVIHLSSVRAKDAAAQQHHAQELSGLKVSRAQQAALSSNLSGLQNTLAGHEADLELLKKHICPTCEQEWHNASLIDKKMSIDITKEKIAQAEAAAVRVVSIDAQIRAFPEVTPDPLGARLEAMLQGVEEQLVAERMKEAAHNNSVRAAALEYLNDVQARISEARARFQQALQAQTQDAHEAYTAAVGAHQQAQDEYRAAVERLVAVEADIARIVAWNNQCKAVHAATTAAAAAAETQLEKARAELVESTRLYSAELDFAALVGREGFLGAIFDEVLAEIADETNSVLAAVPNVAHVTFRFRTETLTAKGVAKRSIAAAVSVGGHEAPMASALSGGMSTAVQLAVDLAVTAVVGRRTGAVPGWLILDEALEGLGLVEKEACLEILQRFASDRLVLVVDHDSVFGEYFTQVIDVVQEGGRSRLDLV